MKKLGKYDNYEESKEVMRMKENALDLLIRYNIKKMIAIETLDDVINGTYEPDEDAEK